MANAIVTKLARMKMVKARAGVITLPKIVGMAFGSGGVDAASNVIFPSIEQTELNNELLRKEVDGFDFQGDTTCRYTCTLGIHELAGENISEIALYDEEGDLVAIKSFTSKGKDDDLEMTFNIDDIF